MKKDVITLSVLCARLERAIHCPVGMKGLNILLYGWITKTGRVSRNLLASRAFNDGEPWISLGEAVSFSVYAGYDLTHD